MLAIVTVLCSAQMPQEAAGRRKTWQLCGISPGFLRRFGAGKDKIALADQPELLHIVAARYCDLRLRSRRPSWAFPP
jgi:hypothetical protein